MGISVGQIKKDQRPLTVDYGTEQVNIVYKPSEWTPAVEQEWEDSEGSSMETFLNFLPKLITSWDVYEDEAQTKVLPLTYENLRTIPSALVMAFINAIGDDMVPGKGSRTNSSGNSRRRS